MWVLSPFAATLYIYPVKDAHGVCEPLFIDRKTEQGAAS